jgi:hypothetical protein
MHYLLIVLTKGKVTDVVCCANGTDSSHKLVQGKDYQIVDVDKMRLDKPDEWLTPKVYKGEKEEEEF